VIYLYTSTDDEGDAVQTFLISAYRSLVREHRARGEHARGMRDPRVAAEHRIARDRSIERGGPGCEYCR
jgi:hypothetical protein